MLELSLEIVVIIITCAFLFEYVDSTLGMGYGTTLTPVLLILGFKPLQIVPVVLLSELITGLLAAFFHHREGNVNLKPKTIDLSIIIGELKSIGFINSLRKGFPRHLKIALLLAILSIVGTVAAVFIAINISKFLLNLYIGCIVFLMGVIIIITMNKTYAFSKRKIVALGLIASFNKGISGGGYGPIVTGGQILSGIEAKSAIGITSLAEGLTCAVGIIAYFLASKNPIDWRLAPYVTLGAMLSVPFSAVSVKRIQTKRLKLIVAVLTIILGAVTLIKTFRP